MHNLANLSNIATLRNNALSSSGSSYAYATLNPSDKSAAITLSWGNLTATNSQNARNGVRSTIGKSSGKWYREFTMGATTNTVVWVALLSESLYNYVGSWDWWWYYSTWYKLRYDEPEVYWSTYTSWDIIWVALDLTASTITMYKNNVSQWVMYNDVAGTVYPMITTFWTNTVVTANFWATAFAYTPPVWFNAWIYTE